MALRPEERPTADDVRKASKKMYRKLDELKVKHEERLNRQNS